MLMASPYLRIYSILPPNILGCNEKIHLLAPEFYTLIASKVSKSKQPKKVIPPFTLGSVLMGYQESLPIPNLYFYLLSSIRAFSPCFSYSKFNTRSLASGYSLTASKKVERIPIWV